VIRFGEREFFGSERLQSDSVDRVVIPRLEREYGANHRSVQAARRRADGLREAELEQLRLAMESLFPPRED
jgi:hypothetical protein